MTTPGLGHRHPPPPPAAGDCTLADLTPDVWASIGRHLRDADLGHLQLTSRQLRDAVGPNDALFGDLYRHRWPGAIAAAAAAAAQPASGGDGRAAGGGGGVAAAAGVPQGVERGGGDAGGGGGWARMYKESALACRQYRSGNPVATQACKQEEPITMLTPSGASRFPDTWVHVSAGSDMWVHHYASPKRVMQLVGSTSRVTAVVPLDEAGGLFATAGADKLIRLWSLHRGAADRGQQIETGPTGDRFEVEFVIPAKTLRGHSEGVTCLHLLHNYGGSHQGGGSSGGGGGAGAALLASGSKDRTIRLWGLHPLLPSSSGGSRPLLSTLRGHGGALTALERETPSGGGGAGGGGCGGAAGGGGGGGGGALLVSGGRDAKAKWWDLQAGCCVHTAKVADTVSLLRYHTGLHACLVAAGPCVYVMDTRAPPAAAAKPFVQLPGASGGIACMGASPSLLVTGSALGAHVWDLRGGRGGRPGHGSGSGGAASQRSSSSQQQQQQRHAVWVLHDNPGVVVGSVHVDGCKIVTADCVGGGGGRAAAREARDPVRVWDPRSGDLLASLPAALDDGHANGLDDEAAGGSALASDGLLQAGVTSLSCFETAMAIGTSAGNVVVWDHCRAGGTGRLQQLVRYADDDDVQRHGSKFWDYSTCVSFACRQASS